jgi:hypothetical protein
MAEYYAANPYAAGARQYFAAVDRGAGVQAFSSGINAALGSVLSGLGAGVQPAVGPLYNTGVPSVSNPAVIERLGTLIKGQTPLPGPNVSVKDDPNGNGKIISVPDTPITSPGTGIGVTNTPSGPQIINTGVISVQSGTGITAVGTNPCVVTNTGIISLSAGPGIQIGGTNPAVIQVDQVPYTLVLGGGAQAFVNSILQENDTMIIVTGYGAGGTSYSASFARVTVPGKTFTKANCVITTASGLRFFSDSSSSSGSGICAITSGNIVEISPVDLPNTGFRFEFILNK